MSLPICSSRKNKATQCVDELNSNPPKREKMQVSTPATGSPIIRIEQLVKHDVWDIRRKDDGAFVMKKLTENDTGTPAANTRTTNINAGNRIGAEQAGARPKVTVEMLKTNNAVTVNTANRLQNVNRVDNTVTLKSVNAPRMEVTPEKNVITLTPKTAQRNSVITINNTPAPPKGLISMKTTAPENHVFTLSASTAPKKEVITINTLPSPKTEVITMSATPSPKKEVITINTKPLVKPAVFTINTSTRKDAELSTSQIKDNVSGRKHTMHNIWNVPKEGNGFAVAGISNKDSGPSVSSGKSDSSVLPTSTPSYSDEVYQIQEMFPQVPLSVISDNLRINGSVESTIDSLLAQAFEEPVPSSEMPPAAPGNDDDDVVFIKSVKADKPKTDVFGGKKGGSLIKIELLTKNEVWDIKKKDKEGFVLKKVGEDSIKDGKTVLEDSVSYIDDSVEVMEEEHDPLLDDILLDGMTHGNPEQSNVPVKLMVYSQSSAKNSQRKVKLPSEGNLDSTMEVDSFDNSCSTPVSVEAFEFSDDENENGETIEYFLFKASLVLAKLKYRCESEIPTTENSALLNITGGMKNEETDVAKEVCSDDDYGDDDDEYYTDECYTDDED